MTATQAIADASYEMRMELRRDGIDPDNCPASKMLWAIDDYLWERGYCVMTRDLSKRGLDHEGIEAKHAGLGEK